MEPVYILGDDRLQFPGSLGFGKPEMRLVGLSVGNEHLALVEVKELLRMGHVIGMAYQDLRRHGVELRIQPVRAAEIRDARFRADARPAEEYDGAAFGYEFLKLYKV